MIVLAGADIVLPDQLITGGALEIRGQLIGDVRRVPRPRAPERATTIDLTGHTIVPGFVDVHVHGTDGVDVLENEHAVAAVAARLPQYGVTRFCPTSVACPPERLALFLDSVERHRTTATQLPLVAHGPPLPHLPPHQPDTRSCPDVRSGGSELARPG